MKTAQKPNAALLGPVGLLDAREAAKRLGVTLPIVRWLMRTGELPYIQFSQRCRRIDPADIDGLIRRRKVPKEQWSTTHG